MNMSQVKVNHTNIRLPTLGRQFSLGQLYDCRSESIITHTSLWNRYVTSKALIARTDGTVAYDVLTGITLESKLKLLRIDNNLEASILGNLVSISGSSNYLNHQTCSKQYDEVTVYYICTTKTENLDLGMLSIENRSCPNVFTNGTATHVVCGIEYGVQAFFVFDNRLSTGDRKSSASLHEAVKALAKTVFESKGLNMSKEVEEQTVGIGCQLYSDLQLDPSYTHTLKDMVKGLNSLSHGVGDIMIHGVPVNFILCPLSEMDSFAACVVRQVSATIVSQLDDTQHHLDKLLIDCINMIDMSIIQNIHGMKKDIENFQQLIGSYKKHFRYQVGHMVTRIRTGTLEENALDTVLREKEKSPFGRQQLDAWIQQKNVHLQILSLCDSIQNKSYTSTSTIRVHPDSSSGSADISYPPNIQSQRSFVTFSNTSPSSIALLGEKSPSRNSHNIDLIVCLNVNRDGMNAWTKLMKNYLSYMANGFLRKFVEVHRCSQSLEYNLKQAEQFKDFVEANRLNDRVKFSFAEDNKDKGNPNVYVSVMQNGSVIHCNYQPPTAPGCSKLVKSVHNKLMIKWCAPEYGKEYTKYYELQFKEVSANEAQRSSQTVQVDNESLEIKYTIQNLQFDTTYEIQVRAICDIGVSKWSSRSTFRTLPATVPDKPMAYHQIPNDVVVQWSKPQELAVTSYIISVSDVNNEDGFDKITDAQNGEEITFSDLKKTSSYTFTVTACFEEGQTDKSAPSDVLGPHPCTSMKEMLLKNSNSIMKGNPSIHLLQMTNTIEREDYKIRKCELGERCNSINEKVIMVLGATGAGKTTLINGLVNYVFGVDWNDTFRFQLIADIDESNEESQADSQTKWITSYTLHHMHAFKVPYSLTVIDTPGFGDTRGIKRDKEITKQIHNFFTTKGDQGIDHIDAIGFVTQASLARLTPTQQFIFDQVLALFGKDISKNIFLLVTFADGQNPPVLHGVKMAGIPYKKFFKFNNSALFAGNEKGPDAQMSFDEMFWKMGEISFKTFLHDLINVTPTSLTLTTDVLNERHSLETYISGIHQHIGLGLNKLEQLRIERDILKKHEADIEINKKFTYEVTEILVKKENIPNGKYITNCLKCNFTCHFPCIFSNDKDKIMCSAMDQKRGVCMVCPKRCIWTDHYNMTYQFLIESVTITKTAEELKSKYEAARGNKLTKEELIKEVSDDFESVQIKVLCLTNEIRKSLDRLKEIALKPNPSSNVQYLDILISKEETQQSPGWTLRKRHLVDVRKQAETLQCIGELEFDPFEEYNNPDHKDKEEEGIIQRIRNKLKAIL